jgi:solute carrier family 13 (sodium-dependent dicarboxylate transporter), member 2/3/5
MTSDLATERPSTAGPSRPPAEQGSPAALRRQQIGLFLGPALFLTVLLLPAPAEMPVEAWRTTAVAVLMATWWISEAIPIPATALLPIVLLPVLGVASLEASVVPYSNPVIFLFMGGFMIALAMQRWGLHRRLALRVIASVGTRPVALVAGFMLAAAALSMWVSNTATAVMMLPIGVSVIELLRSRSEGPAAEEGSAAGGLTENFPVALMLGIAYACSIGGLATLIGTPPNALLAGFMRETYGVQIGFAEWMMVGLPLAIVGLPLTLLVLTRWAYPIGGGAIPGVEEAVRGELRGMGPLSTGERVVGTVFALAALGWMTQPLIARVFPEVTDAGIAVAAAVALFMAPVRLRRGEFALNWEWARRTPWDVLILFGGGLSLASAISRSGLAGWIGRGVSFLHVLPLIGLIAGVVLVIVLLTELTSNTATAAAFLPILASMAVGLGYNPMLLAVPAVLAASCAFMLPVATPPNAIVYGSSFITIPQMARAGLVLNLVFMGIITLLGYALVMLVFGGEWGGLTPP